MAVPALEVPGNARGYSTLKGWKPLPSHAPHSFNGSSGRGIPMCQKCGWHEEYHLHTEHEILIDRVPMGSIPYDAKVTMQDDDWLSGRRNLIFTWDQQGRTAAVKVPVTPQTELIRDFEGHQWWYPYQAAPPPEPASLFARRELTLDELLDPDLFNPLAYERHLDRLVKPEPLPECFQPLDI